MVYWWHYTSISMPETSVDQTAHLANNSAAAVHENNLGAPSAYGAESNGSIATSHNTAQLMQRASITIQRRIRHGRSRRSTPAKQKALVEYARRSAASRASE